MSKGNGVRPGELAKAVAAEIRGELAKKNIPIRRLDSILTSHGYVQARFGKEPTQSLDFTDVELVCNLLDLDPEDLIIRAKLAVKKAGPPTPSSGELE